VFILFLFDGYDCLGCRVGDRNIVLLDGTVLPQHHINEADDESAASTFSLGLLMTNARRAMLREKERIFRWGYFSPGSKNTH
jgi:hypothetical protein